MQLEETRERAAAEAELAGAIKTLFAVAESYPQLRADRNFRELQSQLTQIEDQLQYARRYYNAVVRDLNTKREVFPSSLVGSWFGFGRLPYFQAEDEDREPIAVTMKEGGEQ
jgi:LemA protein